jgi:hypothetical protein
MWTPCQGALHRCRTHLIHLSPFGESTPDTCRMQKTCAMSR